MGALLRLRRHLRFLLPAVRAGRTLAGSPSVDPLARLFSRGAARPAAAFASLDAHLSLPAARTRGDTSWRLEPPRQISHAPSACPAGPTHWKLHRFLQAHLDAEDVFLLHDCRVWGRYGGHVVSPEGNLLLPLSRDIWHGRAHSAFVRWQWPAPERLAGRTALIATPEAGDNFFHWCCELLPRIGLLERAGFGPDAVDTYLVNAPVTGFRDATLEELGIPREKVRTIDGSSHIRCERLIAPSLRTRHWEVPPWIVDWLPARLPCGPSPAAGPRLFVSREGCAFRRLLNLDQLRPVFTARGYVEFTPDRHSLRDQRATFAAAARVAGVHGSAFVNTAWCRPGTPFGELFPPSYVDLAFWTLASAKGLRHFHAIGEGPPPREGVDPRARYADLTVPPERLASLLDAMDAPDHRP